MEKTIKMPLMPLSPVLRLLVLCGVYAEEFIVSDSYIYRELGLFSAQGFRADGIKKWKMDGEHSSIITRTNIHNKVAQYGEDGYPTNEDKHFWFNYPHWKIGTGKGEEEKERYPHLTSAYYHIFRVNRVFLNEIIEEIEKGNRQNYTKMPGSSRVAKKKEAIYNEWRIKALKKLQFVIREDDVYLLLEEQARKLQESGLVAI